jgi:hypothetical protein
MTCGWPFTAKRLSNLTERLWVLLLRFFALFAAIVL